MRTTIEVDRRLLEDVIAITDEKSVSKAVNKALEGYVRHKRIQELRAMLGTIDLADDWYEFRHMNPR